MSLKQSKPINRLYHEVVVSDLVIVPDSPLADALNRRLERPHFGPFAITPRRLASRRRETAEDRTAFLEELPVAIEAWRTERDEGTVDETEQTKLLITVPTPDGPVGHFSHSLMREDVFEDDYDGMGKAFGTDVHEFAEAYARGEDVKLERDDPGWDDKQHVMSFLDRLSGDLLVEEDASLPLDVDGACVMISGIIDLVHFALTASK